MKSQPRTSSWVWLLLGLGVIALGLVAACIGLDPEANRQTQQNLSRGSGAGADILEKGSALMDYVLWIAQMLGYALMYWIGQKAPPGAVRMLCKAAPGKTVAMCRGAGGMLAQLLRTLPWLSGNGYGSGSKPPDKPATGKKASAKMRRGKGKKPDKVKASRVAKHIKKKTMKRQRKGKR